MKTQKNKLLVSIVGPTASGKTAVSLELAKFYKTEIISADSRQFYKEMTVGTAKPEPHELSEVKHHFVNSISAEMDYNVADFEKDALNRMQYLYTAHDLLFLVGGSGLYLHSIWNGFDDDVPASTPELRNELNEGFKREGLTYLIDKLQSIDPEAIKTIDLNNHVRLIRAIEIGTISGKTLSEVKKKSVKTRPFKLLKIGLNIDRDSLYERINQRVDDMVKNGLVKEVKSLISLRDKNALRTVGYQEIFRYFDGDYSLDEAIDKIKINTRHYAKRQMTWFKRYKDIEWYDPSDQESMIKRINENL